MWDPNKKDGGSWLVILKATRSLPSKGNPSRASQGSSLSLLLLEKLEKRHMLFISCVVLTWGCDQEYNFVVDVKELSPED